MAKKGQTFRRYSQDLKEKAVRLYLEEGLSYQQVADCLGVRSSSQVKDWVKRYQEGRSLTDHRLAGLRKKPWRAGRPKTKFSSIEEELAYVKAEVEYLKKRYPNLHGEE